MGALILDPLAALGRATIAGCREAGAVALFALEALSHLFRPPFYGRLFWRAFVEVAWFSLPVVALTAVFTGMVLALQSYTGFARKAFEREDPALGAGWARGDGARHGAGGAGFLDDAVPAAAGLALAFPAVIDRAAFLADEGGVTLGHQPSPPR